MLQALLIFRKTPLSFLSDPNPDFDSGWRRPKSPGQMYSRCVGTMFLESHILCASPIVFLLQFSQLHQVDIFSMSVTKIRLTMSCKSVLISPCRFALYKSLMPPRISHRADSEKHANTRPGYGSPFRHSTSRMRIPPSRRTRRRSTNPPPCRWFSSAHIIAAIVITFR